MFQEYASFIDAILKNPGLCVVINPHWFDRALINLSLTNYTINEFHSDI